MMVGQMPFVSELRSQLTDAASRDPKARRDVRVLLAALPMAAVIAITLAITAQPFADSPPSTSPMAQPRTGAPESSVELGLEAGHPLSEGHRVSLDEARAALEACEGCPAPSPDWLADGTQEAWLDEHGGVGFILRDGVWIVGVPDSRTPTDYLTDATSDQADIVADIVQIGSLSAVAVSAGDGHLSSIAWIEGGKRWEVVSEEPSEHLTEIVLQFRSEARS